ncbi:hypothetical protein Enr10x_21510 [Gimesia panareensis]|uniref:Uncharacterized protein n=1 Tax=Gimesia panareensis TaxID=2527978 RepID=A0A517Q5D5_9PLAN|nr:hypothetical protein Enr10x_21510 [Gimesia panareensis]QDU50323.1 hypothetical protein Pan110_26680 [Gimesia panareensis]
MYVRITSVPAQEGNRMQNLMQVMTVVGIMPPCLKFPQGFPR